MPQIAVDGADGDAVGEPAEPHRGGGTGDQRIGVVAGATERRRLREVSGDDLVRGRAQPAGSTGVADERASAVAERIELGQDVGTEVSGGAGDEDCAHEAEAAKSCCRRKMR